MNAIIKNWKFWTAGQKLLCFCMVIWVIPFLWALYGIAEVGKCAEALQETICELGHRIFSVRKGESQ